MARLKQKYQDEVVPAMMKEFGYKNSMQVPRLEKITVNVGLGEATQNIKVLDTAVAEVTAITGQKPVVTRAKKSIANFKLREGVPIGCMVDAAAGAHVRVSRPADSRRIASGSRFQGGLGSVLRWSR